MNGRNAISWNEKFKLDVWYVKNLSLTLDTKILFLTIKKCLNQKGLTKRGKLQLANLMALIKEKTWLYLVQADTEK